MLGALCRPHGLRRVPDARHPEEGLYLEAVCGHAGSGAASRCDVQCGDAFRSVGQKLSSGCSGYGSLHLGSRWR